MHVLSLLCCCAPPIARAYADRAYAECEQQLWPRGPTWNKLEWGGKDFEDELGQLAGQAARTLDDAEKARVLKVKREGKLAEP